MTTMNYNKFNQLSVFGHSVYLLEAKVVQIRIVWLWVFRLSQLIKPDTVLQLPCQKYSWRIR